MEVVTYFAVILFLLIPFFLLRTKRASSERLPPGSMGLPFIGHSLSLLKAMRTNKCEEWFRERIKKNGPISKLSLFGYPTVFLHGHTANKFIYTCDGNILSAKTPPSARKILGENNIFELLSNDHKRVRAALMTFFKPEVLKQYVPKIDEEIRNLLSMYWKGKHDVQVMPQMKTLTFNVICSLVIGIESGKRRDQLKSLFEEMILGLLTVPVNLPFTQYRRSLEARKRLKPVLMELIQEKRLELEEHRSLPDHDLITTLLSIRNEDNSNVMSDEEVLDNLVVIMIAGYDTSSVLITSLVRLLAENLSVYTAIAHEQEEIARSKSRDEPLTWDDLSKMKYTWLVAKETLRMIPPAFISFRRALKDIEYGGYVIPKGWQVMWSPIMTHMDENLFPDPSKFDLTHFKQQSPAPAFSFVPFGGGVRLCPGYELAKMEALAMVHYLVTHFTWKLTLKDNSFSRKPMPVFNQGLPIQIEPKKI